MHIKDNLINFLYDKNYYMCLYDDSLYCFNYQELLSLSANRIVLKVPKRDIEIKGSNLMVSKMCTNEIMIKGRIYNIGITYE